MMPSRFLIAFFFGLANLLIRSDACSDLLSVISECRSEVTIDFCQATLNGNLSALADGQQIDDTITFEAGLKVKAQSKYQAKKDNLYNDAVIVDASLFDSPGGDLNQPQQGNVLVVTKNAKFTEPNDSKRGGEIVFEFEEPVTVVSLTFLDVDGFGDRIRLFDENGKRFKSINVPKGPHGGLTTVDISASGVLVMQVFINKFSAIDDLVFIRKCPPIVQTAPPAPSEVPTVSPTTTPSDAPTDSPTTSPSVSPTLSPTSLPTAGPTSLPTPSPTTEPTAEPSRNPTLSPTDAPSVGPSSLPTSDPTSAPSDEPTSTPSASPTETPSAGPTTLPTSGPTAAPSSEPTSGPSVSPTQMPSTKPTKKPTTSPTASPTSGPTPEPTSAPSSTPTSGPTLEPTFQPSENPTFAPSSVPTITPTASPTTLPTSAPTSKPTATPTICVKDYFIDFTQTVYGKLLSSGDLVDSSVPFHGASFQARRGQDGRRSPYDDGMIFDGANPTGGDDHHNFPTQGKFLIISEDGNPADATDNSKGGEIIANFTHPVTVVSLVLLSTTELSVVEFYGEDGSVLQTTPVFATGEGKTQRIVPNVHLVLSFRLQVGKTGGMDDVEIRTDCTYEPTPAPADDPTTAPTFPPSTVQNPQSRTPEPTVCLADYIIDFSKTGRGVPLQAGDLIDYDVSFNSVSFKARRQQDAPAGDFDDAMIVDGANAGDEEHLDAPDQGNMLMISQDGDTKNPNNNNKGGEIVATFTQPVTVVSLLVVGIEGTDNYIEFFDADGVLLDTFEIQPETEEENRIVPFVEDITSFTVYVEKTGAIDDIEIWRDCSEEPTSAPTPSPSGPPTVCLEDVIIDFSKTGQGKSLAPGDAIDYSVPFNAATFMARRGGSDGEHDDGIIFDAADYVGGLEDQGNILVVEPDNVSEAGEIVASFSRPVTVVSLMVIGMKGRGNFIEFYDADGVVQEVFDIPVLEAGESRTVVPFAEEVMGFAIVMKNGGGIDDLELWRECDTEEPTAPPTVCENDFFIDFEANGQGEALEAGDLIDDSIPLTPGYFQARRTQDGPDGDYDDAMILDAGDPSAEQYGLSFPQQGNVLIVSQNGDSTDPNDNRRGGEIVATFDGPVTIVSLLLLSMEGPNNYMEFYDEEGVIKEIFEIPELTGGEQHAIVPYAEDVWSFKLVMEKGGAIDDVEIWRDCPGDEV